jgi:hypothetical protein
MEKNKLSALTPWEKLLLLLEPDPEEVALLPIEEVEEKLRAAGIDPEPVVVSVENLVREAMARWEQGARKVDVVRQEAVHSSSYTFDDRHIRWYKMGDFEHFEIAMLDVDVSQKIVDFLIKFEPNQQIFLHRHTALTNTLVVQGEHRFYEPNGALKEVRSVGSYTSSPPGEPHREGGGEEGGVVFYSIRAEEDTLFEVLDDTLNIVGTLSTQDFINALKEQRNA